MHYDPLPPELSAFGQAGKYAVAERLSRTILSLPFDAWLTDDQVEEVGSAVLTSCRGIAERS